MQCGPSNTDNEPLNGKSIITGAHTTYLFNTETLIYTAFLQYRDFTCYFNQNFEKLSVAIPKTTTISTKLNKVWDVMVYFMFVSKSTIKLVALKPIKRKSKSQT